MGGFSGGLGEGRLFRGGGLAVLDILAVLADLDFLGGGGKRRGRRRGGRRPGLQRSGEAPATVGGECKNAPMRP